MTTRPAAAPPSTESAGSAAALPSRERLLRAAAELFYAEGVTATGVDRISRAAGVSKRSLYQLFGTKDALVAESLDRFGVEDVAGYFPADADALPPRDAVLHVFERLDERSGAPGFHGCPFVTTASELHDPGHPASVVARMHKARLAAWFADQARRAGVADPERLGEQLTIVFDGVGARSVVRGEATGLGVATASAVLDAAGMVAP